MAKWVTKRKKRADAKNKKSADEHVKDLEHEKEKLELIRDTPLVFDAIEYYLMRASLDPAEIKRLRLVLLYLSRGE